MGNRVPVEQQDKPRLTAVSRGWNTGLMKKIPFTYFGVLRAPTSWAKVGRRMALGLIDIGEDVRIFERKGFLYNPDFRLPERMTARISQSFRDDAVFTFEHPGVYDYLTGRFKIGMLTYESTVVPTHWVDGVLKHLDVLFLPSTFCMEIFDRAGVSEERTALLPYGYDPKIYFPPAEGERGGSGAPFEFLTVASPHKREGIEKVLAAYRKAFSAHDDVTLTVKLSYLPGKKTKPFECDALTQQIERFVADENAPTVRLLPEYLLPKEVADLYRRASCLVSATRGEGFGLPFLEAAACDLPIIVTGWSGHMDFIKNADARLVDYKLRPAAEMQYDCQSKASLLADPDENDLAQKMREASDERDRLRPAKNRDWLEPYTWNRLAEQMVQIVTERS